jgi:hypothetical protein
MRLRVPFLGLVLVLVSTVTYSQTRSGTKTESGSKHVEPAPAQLSIEAGVVMKSGDVKRVARTEFLLLDADFGAMLVERVTFRRTAGQNPFSAALDALAT